MASVPEVITFTMTFGLYGRWPRLCHNFPQVENLETTMQGLSPETGTSGSHTALNYSGILVVALVGGLGAWSISASALFPLAALLAAVQLVLVILCIRFAGPDLVKTLFVLQAICIAALIFLVPSDFIYILTVVWLVQGVQIYSVRTATLLMIASLVWFAVARVNRALAPS